MMCLPAATWHLVFSAGRRGPCRQHTAQPEQLPGWGLIAEDHIWRAAPRCFHHFGKSGCSVSLWGIPPSRQLVQDWAFGLSQAIHPSLKCLKLKVRRSASSGWREWQDLNTGSMHQPGSQYMEADSLQSRERHSPRRRVRSWLNFSLFSSFPQEPIPPLFYSKLSVILFQKVTFFLNYFN